MAPKMSLVRFFLVLMLPSTFVIVIFFSVKEVTCYKTLKPIKLWQRHNKLLPRDKDRKTIAETGNQSDVGLRPTFTSRKSVDTLERIKRRLYRKRKRTDFTERTSNELTRSIEKRQNNVQYKTRRFRSAAFKDYPVIGIVKKSMQSSRIINNRTVMVSQVPPEYCEVCSCLYKDGFYTDCSGKRLEQIFDTLDQQTVFLNMSHNEIEKVTNSVFISVSNMRVLDLSFNRIHSIDLKSFHNISNLEVLHLKSNRFSLPQLVIREGIFDGLYRLKLLSLQFNVDIHSSVESRLETKAFKTLHGLQTLSVDGYQNISFDANFLSTNLTHLDISGINGVCTIFALKSDMFQGLPKLVSLNLAGCNILYIDPLALASLKSLKTLNISDNLWLGIDNINKALKGLIAHNQLSVLDMRSVRAKPDGGCVITTDNMANINALPLHELYMDFNYINYIRYRAFGESLLNLKTLTLRGNHLFMGQFFLDLIFDHPNMEVLDVGNQFNEDISLNKKSKSENNLEPAIGLNPTTKSVFSEMEKSAHLKTSNYRDSEHNKFTKNNLKTLIITGIPSRSICINFAGNLTEIEYIDFSSNSLFKIFSFCFSNMTRLQFLNLSSSLIEIIEKNAFISLKSLKVLDLSNNLLGGQFLYTDQLFVSLKAMEYLSLAGNRIVQLEGSSIESCFNLTVLDISGNFLTSVDLNLKLMVNLSLLNLANNRLNRIDEPVRYALDNLAERRTLVVDLSENNFLCSCENIDFLNWILNSKIHFRNKNKYVCSFGNGTVSKIKNELVQSLKAECFPYLPVIIVCFVLISCFLVCVLAKIVYNCRWNILYLYYMYKIRYNQENEEQNTVADEFRWDAFLSYDDADAAFVGRDMREHLENGHDLKLHIRHRDFPIAEVNAINISNAVKWSRKTILVLSRQFFRNKWCNFELNMARTEGIFTNRSVIIVVFLEEIPAKYLSEQVLDLLRECHVLELPKESSLMETFWSELSKYVKE